MFSAIFRACAYASDSLTHWTGRTLCGALCSCVDTERYTDRQFFPGDELPAGKEDFWIIFLVNNTRTRRLLSRHPTLRFLFATDAEKANATFSLPFRVLSIFISLAMSKLETPIETQMTQLWIKYIWKKKKKKIQSKPNEPMAFPPMVVVALSLPMRTSNSLATAAADAAASFAVIFT